MQAVLRFAPSPNGRLHLGHLYSALLNERLAAQLGGRFLLRIEDIDTTRCTAELAAACVEDLAWLGIRWEMPVRVQSQHFAEYAEKVAELKQKGLLYACFCSRKRIEMQSNAKDPDGAPIYPQTCKYLPEEEIARRISECEPHAWRLDMSAALAHIGDKPLRFTRFSLPFLALEECTVTPEIWGDVVLVRKDTPTSYHLSVVVDDALQGITHVVRGKDLEAATPLHILLQKLLGLPTPLYHHHELLQDSEGKKLSKSLKSQSIHDLREEGGSPEEIRRIISLYLD